MNCSDRAKNAIINTCPSSVTGLQIPLAFRSLAVQSKGHLQMIEMAKGCRTLDDGPANGCRLIGIRVFRKPRSEQRLTASESDRRFMTGRLPAATAFAAETFAKAWVSRQPVSSWCAGPAAEGRRPLHVFKLLP
jgi:hypothetical protein